MVHRRRADGAESLRRRRRAARRLRRGDPRRRSIASRAVAAAAATRAAACSAGARPRPPEIEVAMPLVHGGFGEDGTLQGLLEMASIPYTGSDVAASAVAMDKHLTKTVLRGAGLPVLDDVVIHRDAWHADQDAAVRAAEAVAPYPLYVKPVSLGSSIGVSRAADAAELRDALEVALTYDVRCIVEAGAGGHRGGQLRGARRPRRGARVPARAADQARPAHLRRQVPIRRRQARRRQVRRHEGRAADRPGAAATRRSRSGCARPRWRRSRPSARRAWPVSTSSSTSSAGRSSSTSSTPSPARCPPTSSSPTGCRSRRCSTSSSSMARRRHARARASTAVFDRWMLGGGGAKTSP